MVFGRFPKKNVKDVFRPDRTRARMRVGVLGLICAFLAGCGSPAVLTREMRIEVVAQANDDSPVAVDLVVAFSDVAFARVATMPPHEWFDQRSTILAAFPNQVKVVGWELVPGQSAPARALPFDTSKAVGALVLARYHGRIVQREAVGALPFVLVTLGRDSMSVGPDPLNSGEGQR